LSVCLFVKSLVFQLSVFFKLFFSFLRWPNK
jgi:hypothetical protein